MLTRREELENELLVKLFKRDADIWSRRTGVYAAAQSHERCATCGQIFSTITANAAVEPGGEEMEIDREVLRRELIKKHGRGIRGVESMLRSLGLDSAKYLKQARDNSIASIVGREKRGADHEAMAAHGHMPEGGFDDDVTQFLTDCGMDDERQSKLYEMLAPRQHIRGELSERTTEDDMETERDLESEKNVKASSTNYNKRDEAEAAREERRNSIQNESMPHSAIKGRRMAGDADINYIAEQMARIGGGGTDRTKYSVGPANFALDSVERNKKFLERLARLEGRA
jgi:hypothetical protein